MNGIQVCFSFWGVDEESAMYISRCLKELFHFSPFDLHPGFLDVFEKVGILHIGREKKNHDKFCVGTSGTFGDYLNHAGMDGHAHPIREWLAARVQLGRKGAYTVTIGLSTILSRVWRCSLPQQSLALTFGQPLWGQSS